MQDPYQPNYEVKETAHPNDLYASQMQEERTLNLIQQISPDNDLLNLQWRIKGYIKDPFTQKWKKADPDAPEIHPVLVSRYVAFLSSKLSQNTTLSNYSVSEINQIVHSVIRFLVDDLDANAEEYNLEKNFTERDRICAMIVENTLSVFKRAQNGMESRRIFNALNVTESLNPMNQKKGFMDAFKFWK